MKIQMLKNSKMICLMAITACLGWSSCQDELLQPQITELFRVEGERADREVVATTFILPGAQLFITGNNLGDISSITFRNLTNANAEEVPCGVFSPTLNSDKMISVTVPWDSDKSSFGPTEIKITNKDGNSSVFETVMRKPNVSITTLIPEDYQAKPGETVQIIGRWFQGVKSVLLGTMELEFVKINDSKLTFKMPDVVEGDTVYVYVEGDLKPAKSAKKLNPYLGKLTLLNDFDGNGYYVNNGFNTWPSVDDNPGLSVSIKEGGPYGKYAEYINRSVPSFYVRYNGDPTQPQGWIEQRDPSKVIFIFDVSCGAEENVGTSFELRFFTDWGPETHNYKYTFDHTGWKHVMIRLSELKEMIPGTTPCDFNMVNYILPNGTTVLIDNVTVAEQD